MDVNNFVLNATSLMVVVFGLVEFSKVLGLKGKWLTVASLLLGVAVAAIYKAAFLIPGIYMYVEIAFFGLTIGLAATGIYDFVNKRMPAKG